MRKSIVLTVTAMCAFGLLGCGDSEEEADSTTTEAPGSSTTSADVASGDPGAANVYWSWSIPASVGTPERLGAGGREVDAAAPASAALDALLGGPDATESEIGMGTEIPEGTEVLSLDISESGTATVDLSSEFEVSGGTLGESIRTAQVVYTLTQFDSVDSVEFQIDGEPRQELGSHGLDVSGGVDRDDFGDVRPMILLESPYPGAAISETIEIAGESNTFEANVQWTVTDSEGLIVEEGFTTADGGNGTWGRFGVDVPVPEGLVGRGAVIVFDTSAEDGSQQNVVEYPVTFS